MTSDRFWSRAQELEEAAFPFVVVTLVAVRGEAPQNPGAKAIVTEAGLDSGTVGGGKLEARAILHALELLKNPSPPQLITWNLQRDIGMTCGGEAQFLFEHHHAQSWSIVVFGAGHVAQALVRTLLTLQCQVTCIDHRSEWTQKLPTDPRLRSLCLADPVQTIQNLSKDSYFVVMTQGHATDLPILQELFTRFPKCPYIGVMGSEIKAAKMRRELAEFGISNELIERLHCPIGLKLGSHSPSEISISVTAQLLQTRDRLS